MSNDVENESIRKKLKFFYPVIFFSFQTSYMFKNCIELKILKWYVPNFI